MRLHNVTLYVERSRFPAARGFYRALLATDPMWEEPGHIACFGSGDLAVCVHEAEPGHDAGTRELFFWADDLDAVQADVAAAGFATRRARGPGTDELHFVDPEGNDVRVHLRRPPG